MRDISQKIVRLPGGSYVITTTTVPYDEHDTAMTFLFGGGESRIAIGIPYGIALQLGEAIADCARHIQREMEK